MTFIPTGASSGLKGPTMAAWKRGDVEQLTRVTAQAFAEYPAFGERLLGERNRAWMPKIEGYLRSARRRLSLSARRTLADPTGSSRC
jgi:uncharacterized protein YbaP (TraB family)